MELIKPLLHKTLGRVYDNRDKKVIHCSDLTSPDFCAREHYIYNKFKCAQSTQFIATATQITWQYGRFIENELRNTWLRDEVIGNWKCSKCDEMFRDFSTLGNTKFCKCKNKNNYYYVEPVFEIKHLNILGSPDCFVYHDSFGVVPIEIKTIDKDAFIALSKVSGEHEIRSQLYLKLIRESTLVGSSLKGTIHTDFMQIVYFSKAFGIYDKTVKGYNPDDRAYSPIKEFTVYRNDENVQLLWDKLTTFKDSMLQQVPPDRICDTIKCTRAKKCNVREVCFTQMGT